jgi:hypothetical protein
MCEEPAAFAGKDSETLPVNPVGQDLLALPLGAPGGGPGGPPPQDGSIGDGQSFHASLCAPRRTRPAPETGDTAPPSLSAIPVNSG